ncbi:S1 family peptidase [Catellatospora methionotrophica]|uniref:S1 family peptidase n=1 Tax=Catellatospora methionotrophica TaxID=121620 RepID=UPI0033F50331
MVRWKKAAFSACALGLAVALLPPVSAAARPAAAAGPAGVDWFAEEAAGFAKERGISEAEARERMSWQLVAPDLDERLQTDLGARFGSVWIDVRDGDRVKVGVTGQVDGPAQSIVKAAAQAVGLTRYDLVGVKRSAARLAADNDWLAEEVIRVNRGATVFLSAGLRPDLNAVQLGVPGKGELTTAQKDLVKAAQTRLGDGVVPAATSGGYRTFLGCDAPYCDAPLRGGVKINHPDVSCTSGFVAQSKVDSKKYIVTAGHCAMGNLGTWSSKNAALTPKAIGPVHHWIFDTYIGDMAIIRISDTSIATGWDPRPWVMVTYSPQTNQNTAYHIAEDKMSLFGMRVCTTGMATRVTNCGIVIELGLTANLGGLTMRNLGRTTNCSKPGDSGAPMFASHVAYGILVGGVEDDCDTVYQGIRTAERELNVNILH